MSECIWWDCVVLRRHDFNGDQYDAETYTYGDQGSAVKKAREMMLNQADAALVFKRERHVRLVEIEGFGSKVNS